MKNEKGLDTIRPNIKNQDGLMYGYTASKLLDAYNMGVSKQMQETRNYKQISLTLAAICCILFIYILSR